MTLRLVVGRLVEVGALLSFAFGLSGCMELAFFRPQVAIVAISPVYLFVGLCGLPVGARIQGDHVNRLVGIGVGVVLGVALTILARFLPRG